jgi:predicted nucleotidyltransferase
MFEEQTKYKTLQPFFRKPTTKHQIREVSRETGVSLPSTSKYIRELTEEGFLEKVEEGTYPGYKASMNQKFKLYKKLETLRVLEKTGLTKELERSFHPNAIVLYGSASKGEDTEKSDIDLLIVAEQKDFELEEYEKQFNRPINLQFITEKELKQNKEFTNSVANGTVLKGFLKVK